VDANRISLDQFNPHFERINEELSKSLRSRVPLIQDIGKHSLLGEGKRLRPLLFVLSSQLCGYQGDDVYLVSTTFEYVHTASLLHDDVIDNAEVRRNKPSASHVWGNSAAVLTGDYLSLMASSIALTTNNMDFFKVAVDTATRMTEGQALELVHTHNWSISKDDYMKIITSKTGALMSAACSCGAIIAEADEETEDHLRQFGLNLGIAFQLMDDVLDYTSSKEEFGKPVGKDLREGKITLPLIYTLSNLEKGEIRGLEDLFKNHKAEEKDYNRIIAMVRNNGAIDRIRSEAKGYVDKAAGFLDFFPGSTFKEDLIGLNAYMVKRRY
jgi:octaprenyl-diphosphate synthase